MKNQKSILIILFVSILSFSSCKDDDDEANTPATVEQTNTEKLCGKNFIISDFLLVVNGTTYATGILDTNFFPACNLDDIFRYETNGIATINDGATKCDPNDPQADTTNWAFYDSETKIIFEPGPDADTNDIITNDGTVLILGGREIEMGDTLEYTQTYRAQ